MEAYAGAAPAAGVFAGYGTAATRSFTLRRRRGSPRSSAGRVRLVRAPPPRAAGDSGDLPPLDKWDIMELDFGRFLGEDPKLTLAKVRPVSMYSCLLQIILWSWLENMMTRIKMPSCSLFEWEDYLVAREYDQHKNAVLLTI
jgi:hypothetical protein